MLLESLNIPLSKILNQACESIGPRSCEVGNYRPILEK